MLQTRVVGAGAQPDPPQSSDYALLKRRIKDAGLLVKQPWFYAMCITANLGMLGVCLLLLILLKNPWLIALDAVALGMSFGWWVDKHNRHHASPNHVDDDPDINNLAIAYNREQALERRGPMRWLAAYQAFAFFPMLFFLGVSMHVSSVAYQLGRTAKHRGLEFGLMAGHLVLYVGLLVLFLGPWLALLVIVIHKGVGGFYMASVFAPNHKGMPQIDDEAKLDFLRAQVLTARNVRSGAATDLWYGSLNYQIEHHLFPAMPRNRVRAAHGIVREFCGEVGVSYYETSMIQSYRELLGFLHWVGQPLRPTRRSRLA
jgi:fatty acid desaturase